MTGHSNHLRLTQPPVAKAEMLIRRAVSDVFEAFVDPEITSKFWFTTGSGKVELGKRIQWDWAMYGVSAEIEVKEFEQDRRILVEWPSDGVPSTVEWTFTAHADDATFVSIVNSGFSGTGDEVVAQVIGATEGFTLVLAGLKAFLEHNILLNLVADRFPGGLAGHD